MQNSGNILAFAGNTQWTQRLWNQAEPACGDGYASFLLGVVSGSSNYPVCAFFRQWYFAPYFQDDWKVTRRLTLNLGLRWDYNGPPEEKYNRLNRGFNAGAPSSVAEQILAEMLAQYPQLRDLKGGLQFAGVGGLPRSAGNRDLNNWQPRIGAVFQISPRLVMGGGYGVYFLNPSNDYLQTVGFSTSRPIVNSLDGGRRPIPNILSDPFPSGINVPTGASRGLLTYVGQNASWFNADSRIPFVRQGSFGFQYQLTRTSTLDLSYIGSRTVGDNDSRAFNIPSLAFRRECNLLEGGSPAYCQQALPNPFRNVPAFLGTGFYTASTVSRYHMNRPFPQFSGDMTELGHDDRRIWHNALQVSYNLRTSRNVTLLVNYILSKTIERSGWNDAFAGVMQQGPITYDRLHMFKATTVYELPFGKGQRWGAGSRGVLQKLISGWEITTFLTANSGEPMNLPGNVIILKDPKVKPNWNNEQVRFWSPCLLRQYNEGTIRPQQYSIDKGCGTDWSNYHWLMTASYAPRVTPYRSGQIRAHPWFGMDTSLNKMTTIGERARVQLGIEAFNALNHTNFGWERGITDPNSLNFGLIFLSQSSLTSNGSPRQVQLRLKFYW